MSARRLQTLISKLQAAQKGDATAGESWQAQSVPAESMKPEQRLCGGDAAGAAGAQLPLPPAKRSKTAGVCVCACVCVFYVVVGILACTQQVHKFFCMHAHTHARTRAHMHTQHGYALIQAHTHTYADGEPCSSSDSNGSRPGNDLPAGVGLFVCMCASVCAYIGVRASIST